MDIMISETSWSTESSEGSFPEGSLPQVHFSWINDAITKMTSCHRDAGASLYPVPSHHKEAPDFFRVSNSELSEVTLPSSLRLIRSESTILIESQASIDGIVDKRYHEDTNRNVFQLESVNQHLSTTPKPKDEKAFFATEDTAVESSSYSISSYSERKSSIKGCERHENSVLAENSIVVDDDDVDNQNHTFERSSEIKPDRLQHQGHDKSNCTTNAEIDVGIRDTERDDATARSYEESESTIITEYYNSNEVQGHEIISTAYLLSKSRTMDENIITSTSQLENQDVEEGSCEIFDSEYEYGESERKRKSRGFLPLLFKSPLRKKCKKNPLEGALPDTRALSVSDEPEDAPIKELPSRLSKTKIRARKALSKAVKKLRKSKPTVDKSQLSAVYEDPSKQPIEWEIISCTDSLEIFEISN